MCGISGFVNKSLKKEDMGLIINQMNEIILHRGPDGEGYYSNDTLALGHRRLAIIDLDSRSNQPLKNDKYVLVFNGEIYNYKELKKQLKDYNYLTNSDSEVILAAYKKWGEECVSHFRGMWSFILYDIEKNILFCSRDRFGIKPFYYYENVNYIAFASEIKQFTVLPEWSAIGNKDRIQDFLVFSVLDHTEETMFKNVKQLRPGNNLIYNLETKKFNIYKYYDLEKSIDKEFGDINIYNKFYNVMVESVREHMISDVKVGSCLSGGLDSSTIVTLMNDMLQKENESKKIDTVSSCFNNKKYDEQEYIDEINNLVEANPHKIFPNTDQLMNELEDLIWHQDEPFGSTSIFAQRKVFEEARKNNLKAMLDGQGADEQLCGYGEFYFVYLTELFLNKEYDEFEKELNAILAENPSLKRDDLYYLSTKRPMESLEPKLKMNLNREGKFIKPTFEPYYDYYKELIESMKTLKSYSIHQFVHNLPELLHYEDRNSMTYSIESRVPFLDHRVVEFNISCKSNEKIRNGIRKYVLRKAMEEKLPSKIVNRKDKMGFVTPEIDWIRNNNEVFRKLFQEGCDKLKWIIKPDLALSWFDDTMISEKDFDFTIWRIVCIGKWMEIFNIKEIS